MRLTKMHDGGIGIGAEGDIYVASRGDGLTSKLGNKLMASIITDFIGKDLKEEIRMSGRRITGIKSYRDKNRLGLYLLYLRKEDK